MFKKSNTPGDRTPKQETKEAVSKAEPVANQPAPAAEKTAAPATEAKKS